MRSDLLWRCADESIEAKTRRLFERLRPFLEVGLVSLICQYSVASDASEKLGKRIEFTPADVLANADYCGAGYGVLTDAEREAVKLFAKYEGLLLDPVYTGRAAARMIDLIRKGFFKTDETVLFWHTGGQPALFAEKYANKI